MRLSNLFLTLALAASSLSSPLRPNTTDVPPPALPASHTPFLNTHLPSTSSPGWYAFLSPNGTLLSNTTAAPSNPHAYALTPHASPKPQPGVYVVNHHDSSHAYMVFPNKDGHYGERPNWPTLSAPSAVIHVKPYSSLFVPLATDFRGHIQRTLYSPSTWAEFHMGHAKFYQRDGKARGWVNLRRGCDGPVEMSDVEGKGGKTGFKTDLVAMARSELLTTREDGVRVINAAEWTRGYHSGLAESWFLRHRALFDAYYMPEMGRPTVVGGKQQLRIDFW